MSTTHHQVVGKCDSSEACEFTGENNLGRETRENPVFFQVKWLPEVHSRVSVSGVELQNVKELKR